MAPSWCRKSTPQSVQAAALNNTSQRRLFLEFCPSHPRNYSLTSDKPPSIGKKGRYVVRVYLRSSVPVSGVWLSANAREGGAPHVPVLRVLLLQPSTGSSLPQTPTSWTGEELVESPLGLEGSAPEHSSHEAHTTSEHEATRDGHQDRTSRTTLSGEGGGALELPLAHTKSSPGAHDEPSASASPVVSSASSPSTLTENSRKVLTSTDKSDSMTSGKPKPQTEGWVGVGGGAGMAKGRRTRDYLGGAVGSGGAEDLFSQVVLDDCDRLPQDTAARVSPPRPARSSGR